MRRFEFNLETLLQLRMRKEEQVRLELAKRNREINQARNELASIHDELTNLQATQKGTRAHTSNIIGLKHSVAYRHKLKQEMLSKGRQIDRMRGDARTLKVSLQIASKEKKAVELLKERRFDEWRKKVIAEEQAITDDISQQGYSRKKHGMLDFRHD
ncbi:MAG: flagellar export protein FliJ [Chitinivibrionales bacterium]|nr:flagellar export protein FliJ [Chitinivibrionales bacterium]